MEQNIEQKLVGIYTVYDKVAEKMAPLFESENDATAARQFIMTCRSKNDPFVSDFKLVRVGSMNQKTMELSLEKPPRDIMSGEKAADINLTGKNASREVKRFVE